jgi:hypothetical protein
LSNDLPYFNWISIHKHWSDYSKSFYRRASVEDLYFQIFSSLAYGSKGILYYNFWNENPFYINNPWHEEQGILDYDLKETGLYPAVIKINNQLSKLGDTLLQLQSVGVYHKNEKYYNSSLVTNPKKHIELEYLYNPNLEKFEYRYGIKLVDWNDPSNLNEQELKNKFIHNIDNPAALLGLFQGVDSSYYFMLVNKNRRKVEKFTVYIDKSKLKNESAINILELCSNSRVIPSKSNNRMIIISLELSPGYGKLFKIN